MTNASNGSDTIISLLARNAKSYPDQVAMREKDLGIWQSYTWREYLDEVLALAAGFEGLGFKEKDAMLVLGDNKSQMYFGILGVSSLRGYPTPVFPDSTPEEILHLARDCGARFALADDQEQVDKLLDLREQLGHLDYIIYRDSRGMGTYTDEGLIAYDEIREKGAARLKAEPGLDQSIIGRTTPDDETIFLHSSGTTGKPKSILLKHRHMLFSMRAAREGKVFEEGEETLAYLPMAWVGDFAYTVAGGIVLRFTVNIPESQETVMHDLCETAPTMIFAPPRMWENMLTSVQVRMESSTPLKRWLFNRYIQLAMDMERDKLEGRSATWWQQVQKRLGEFFVYGSVKDQMGLSRVKRAFTGGEAMGEETFLFYRAIGVNLKQGYGLTEASAFATIQPDDEVLLQTVGRPLPGINIRFSDDGEILIKSESVFDGYHQNPEATAEALKDGWFYTGDTGFFDDHGHLVVLGRISEVMYTEGGDRYVPNYIENRLKFSPYVKDAAVVGSGRSYLAAIVCIEMEAVGHWAEVNGVSYTSYADLCQKPEVYELINGAIAHVNRLMPEALHMRRYINLHKEFDPDDGELTRTRKLRRRVVEERYANIIQALYTGQDSIDMEARITYETGETGVIRRELAIREVK